MPVYRYSGVNPAGFRVQGEMQAQSPDATLRLLSRINLLAVSCREVNRLPTPVQRIASYLSRQPVTLSTQELEQLTRDVAVLLHAGLPLTMALEHAGLVAGQSRVASFAHAVVAHLNEGESLSGALRRFPHALPARYCHIVEVAEASGRLPAELLRLAEQIGSRHQMQNRMRRALIYPLLVLLVLLGLVTFLVSVVIPSLAEFMLELDQSLPWHTRWLVGWCSWMRHYAPWLLLATAGLLSLLVLLRNRSGSFRLHTDRYLVTSRFPGCLIRDWFAAGFTHDLAALHGAGVALLPALNSTESLSRNRYIVLNLRLIMRQVNDGIGLAGAMRSTGLFNADCLHLILLAEKSGDYAKGLVQAEQLSGKRLMRRLEHLERAVGPVMMVVTGLLILWIIVSVVSPVYTSAITAGGVL